jgi:hypothetical protein
MNCLFIRKGAGNQKEKGGGGQVEAFLKPSKLFSVVTLGPNLVTAFLGIVQYLSIIVKKVTISNEKFRSP